MQMELTEEERLELLKLTEGSLAETRVEIRHTKNRDWKDELHKEEDMLRGLLEKLGAGVTV